jgi:two-component system OmpR family sensor kinase
MAAISPLTLQQVFLNLLLNATAAMRGRAGSIIVATTAGGSGRVRITVADDGPGIPPDLAVRIFDPFFSRDVAVEPEPGLAGDRRGGSGLGLAICKRAIESVGGRISVGQTPGGGATFVIDLPRGHAPAASNAEPAARSRSEAA